MSPKKKLAADINIDQVVEETRRLVKKSPLKTTPQPGLPPKESYSTTAINLPSKTLALLKQVAGVRAAREGGRISVSAVLARLVEEHRAELEAEIKG
jgi:hypothetical protein